MGDFSLAADGVEIHYEKYGQGTPALVFVHGWCCDSSYWQKQVEHFAQHYTVVTIDLAGHGASGDNRSQWTMAAFGQDVVAVVEQLGLTQTVLIGHSMGGPVIVEAARQMPTRVTGLVGADTLLNPDRKRTEEFITSRLTPLQSDFVQGTRAMVRGEMFVPTSNRAWAEWIIEDMASAPPHAGVGAMEGLLRYDDEMRAGLRALQAPFVLINSDYHPTNHEATDRFGITVELMAGVGHFVMLEDTATFNALLEGAVRRMVERGFD